MADMPPALTLDDVRGLLDDTTRELGRHLANVPGVVGMQAQRVETLQRMIDAFVEERRQEDRHTAGMLDTMQQALIQLIDRIEQADLRLAPAAEPVPADFAGQFPHEAAPPVVAPVHEPMPEQLPEEPPRPFGRRAAEPVPAPAPVQAEPQAQAQAEGQPVAAGQEAPSAWTVKPRSPKGDEYVPPKDAAGKPQPQIDVAALRAKVRAEVATTATTPASAGAGASAPVQAPASSRGSRAPVMQPQAQPQPAAEQASTEAEGGAVLNSRVVRRGLAVVGVAFVLMGASALAHFYLSERLGLIRAPAPAAQATAPVEGMAPSFSDEDERGRRAPAPRDDRRSSAGSFGTQEVTPAALEAPPSEREIRATRSAPAGITLQQPAVPLTPVELQRIQQRQYSAQASTHLGVAAGRPSDATEQQARLEPERGEQAPVEVELTPSGELPPAMIGPLSLRLAAQQGEPGAEFEVASRFAEGKGVKADFKKAMEWYQRAAQKGFVPAQYRLGTLYERGLSGKPDLQRARVWYKRAAEQGNVKAMHNLAVLSAGRESGSPDYPNAAQWFQEAADRGLADSQFNLGVLYENGLGVPKDPGQAYKWYALASRSGDKEAIRRRDQMQARMDLADVKVADDMVASWRPRSVDARANDARAAADAWRERTAAAQPAPQNMAPPPAAQNQAQPAQAQPPAEPPKVRVMQGTPGNPGPPIR